MTDSKSLGQILTDASKKWQDAYEERGAYDPNWREPCNEYAAQAIRRAVIDECIQSVSQSSWKHEGDDAYSKGMDQGARHQVDACIEALEGLKGETDDA